MKNGFSLFVSIFCLCVSLYAKDSPKSRVIPDQSVPENASFGQCVEDHPDMKCIPAGFFIRGSNHYERNERPEEKVYVSEFYIDTYEVTTGAFTKCIKQGKCADCLKKGKCSRVNAAYGRRYSQLLQPMVGISWYSAKEYCEFVGKRLPTEAEWEKAARGPDGNLYPWGNEKATCQLAIIEEDGRKGCVPKILEPDWYMPTQNVGTKRAGAYGLYDMAGNSWEWINDFYTESYAKCGKYCSGKDPKGPCNGADRCPGYNRKIVRGGSWWWTASYARGSYRRPHIPENTPEYHHFGFRCAKSPNRENVFSARRRWETKSTNYSP
jgi:formylglycine-generating enzyme